MGNVVNRVFDSSGPEGKVRGTPQQIIDKYNQLARDSQLSGDRVATENFQQHAEHYTRMLAEAMREQQERQERQQQQQQSQQNQNRGQNDGGGQDSQGGESQGRGDNRQNRDGQPSGDDGQRKGGDDSRPRRQRGRPEAQADDVIDTGAEDSGLVETPEEKPKRSRRSRQKADTGETEPTPDAAE